MKVAAADRVASKFPSKVAAVQVQAAVDTTDEVGKKIEN